MSTKVSLACAGLLFLSGCIPSREVPLNQCGPTKTGDISQLNLMDFVEDTTRPVCVGLIGATPNSTTPYIVPDAVDSETLTAGPPGVRLGEMIRKIIVSECEIPVRLVEFVPQYSMKTEGSSMLSRQSSSVQQSDIAVEYAIVSSYSLDRTKLRLSVQRVRVADSVIEKISTKELMWSCRKPVIGAAGIKQKTRG
ncbi:MAG: hypothetical protein FJ184_10150 [Gammaproteobacteria bacterium]|nr:hypothetical protein [Gammaproteobacteria bacterium]